MSVRVVKELDNSMVQIQTMSCVACNKTTYMSVKKSGLESWNSVYVQDAFPELNADDRELLMTGTHATCWEDMFGEEE